MALPVPGGMLDGRDGVLTQPVPGGLQRMQSPVDGQSGERPLPVPEDLQQLLRQQPRLLPWRLATDGMQKVTTMNRTTRKVMMILDSR